MKVFVINLKRSIDRKIRMENVLSNAGIPFEFIEAVDSSSPGFLYSERRNEARTRKRFGYKLVENEIACFSSHHLAWEKCLELNEPILILEDNCDFSPHFFEVFSYFDTLAQKYDFLKLAATKPKSFKVVSSLDDKTNIVRFYKRTCGIMGYIITPHAASKFIENASEFIEPVDDYMEKPYKHGISTYVLNPDVVRRADIPSTIGCSRKDKSGATIWNKVYIELFRLYEQIQDSLVSHPDK
ncbi:glycosyltransferase family 25 protein [Vibrio campbellii]